MTSAETNPQPTDLRDAVREALLALPTPTSIQVTDCAAQTLYGQLFGAFGGGADAAACAADASAGVVLAVKKLDVPLWHLARGAVVGVLHAALGRHLEAGPILRATVERMMSEADGFGADYGAVAQGAVEGAIIAAEELGLSGSELGSEAATYALEKATEMGPVAKEKVRHLVDRRVMGYSIRIPSRVLDR